VPDDPRRERLRLGESALEIALLDWGGEGPPVLLHHANGFCAALWAPVAEKLCSRFRVFAMDARGHGDSAKPAATAGNYSWARFGADAAAVADLLTQRHGRLPLAIGHSFGGTALVLAAIERPHCFERLLLLDPVVLPSGAARRARISRGHVLAEAARRRRAVWASRAEAREAWAAKDMCAGWEPAALDLYVREGLRERDDGLFELKCSGEVEATIYENNLSVDVMALLPKLEAPAAVVWARRGHFPRAHMEALASAMRRGVLREAPTGHFVPMEDPSWVVQEALAAQLSVG